MPEKLKLSLNEIARISLNRPEKKNALDIQLFTELKGAVETVKKSEARVLILSGEGDTFCSGLDRDLMMELGSSTLHDEDRLREMIDLAQSIIQDIRNLEIPVIAAVKRYAIGGGMQLALAADIRIASPGTVFCIREPEFGLVPDMGAIQILPRLIGDGLARDMILTRREVRAEEGKTIGLVNEIYDDLERGVEEYTKKLLSVPLLPLKESKGLIERGWRMSLGESLKEAKESQLKCIRELRSAFTNTQ